jgi:hypothetical protein
MPVALVADDHAVNDFSCGDRAMNILTVFGESSVESIEVGVEIAERVASCPGQNEDHRLAGCAWRRHELKRTLLPSNRGINIDREADLVLLDPFRRRAISAN